jgi:hypothetical protein
MLEVTTMFKNRAKLFSKFILLIVLFGFCMEDYGQTQSIDTHRMNRDLRIMEGVLDKLLNGRESFYSSGGTKGVYLPEFGVIFNTRYDAFREVRVKMSEVYKEQAKHIKEIKEKIAEEHEDVEENLNKIKEDMEQIREESLFAVPDPDAESNYEIFAVPGVWGEADEEERREKMEEEIDHLKDKMFIFFKNYATAIGQLGHEQRIALLIHLGEWQYPGSDEQFLTGWTTRKDLDLYRQNKISESDYLNQIHYQISDSQSEVHTDIVIMTEILERGLDVSTFSSRTNKGLYLDGLGALIFMEIPRLHLISDRGHLSLVRKRGTNNETIYIYGDSEKKGESDENLVVDEEGETTEEWISEIEDNLFDLISSYGHTLRIKPQESVVLNVNLGENLIHWNTGEDYGSRLLLKLMKKDLDDFNRGTISIKDLRRKLISQTY